VEATTQMETSIVNAENLHGLDNQQLSSCSENLEPVQRLTDLSYDSKNDLVICRLCGVTRRKLYFHLRCDHNLSQQEYLKQFPGAKLFSNLEMNYRKGFLDKGRNLDTTTRLKTNEILSNRTKEFHKSFWTSNNPEVLDRRRKLSKAGQTSVRSQCRFKQYEYQGITYKLRSNLEFVFIQFLIDNQIEYQCEPFILEIGEVSTTPDFYLPKYNLVIECKGYYWYRKRQEMYDKVIAGVKAIHNYNYLMLIDVETKPSLQLLLDKLDTSSSAILYTENCVI